MGRLKGMLGNPASGGYYIIGETAYNFMGDAGYLGKMVEDLAALGADAVKFHIMLNPDGFMTRRKKLYEEIGSWLLPKEAWEAIIGKALGLGLEVVVLPDEPEALDFTLDIAGRMQVEAIELHAASLNEVFMLEKLQGFGGVRVLGIGGSGLDEIAFALAKLAPVRRDNMLLMHGVQNYPTDYTRVKLCNMARLSGLFGVEVGYADHTSFDDPHNAFVTAAGFLAGARVIEKHYTLDEGKPRIDYQSSVGRDRFAGIKALLEVASLSMGRAELTLNEAERSYGAVGIGKKAIVARRRIPSGMRLSREDIAFKLTDEASFVPQRMIEAIGEFVASRDIEPGEMLDFGNVRHEAQG